MLYSRIVLGPALAGSRGTPSFRQNSDNLPIRDDSSGNDVSAVSRLLSALILILSGTTPARCGPAISY